MFCKKNLYMGIRGLRNILCNFADCIREEGGGVPSPQTNVLKIKICIRGSEASETDYVTLQIA